MKVRSERCRVECRPVAGAAVEIESFDEFYLGTRATLLGQLTAMTADPEVAKEVLQEAYAQAWQRWSRVSRLDDPTAWVRTVAWRRSVSVFRRRMVADRFLRTVGRTRAEISPGSPLEEMLDVRAALRLLPDAHRRTLVLHDLCGLTMEQVADETGVSVGTVKSRLSRGRDALRAHLGSGYRSEDVIRFGEETT
ncbi:sigma-70 family RNA polymerase sigma factor [Nocardioides guangzhouensis]|uniref:Sigma-70 family RNA polymerase sigma factor n=1 Tax=Nocardioides guangzhouensis TaxID=2497878 RepID=A0A4Q4ZCS3_9ACTN|nr:sigma-70 family RNA polymerase sigma factor [Nocardioides guangzhouensis]